MRRTTRLVLFFNVFGAMVVAAALFWAVSVLADSLLQAAKTDGEVMAGFLLYLLAIASAATTGFGIPYLSLRRAARKMEADPSEEE